MMRDILSFLSLLTHSHLGDVVVYFKRIVSEHKSRINFVSTSCEIALARMPLETFDGKSSFVRVMVVPLGNRPIPEPMLTQIYVTAWRH